MAVQLSVFVRITDREAAGVVFPHPGIGVLHRCVVTKAADIHRPDIKARIAVDHPVGQRQPDAATLTKPGHDTAGTPEIRHPPDRPDQRVAIRRKGEGPLMICLIPAFSNAGKCLKPTSSDGAIRSISGSRSSWPKLHGVSRSDQAHRPFHRCP